MNQVKVLSPNERRKIRTSLRNDAIRAEFTRLYQIERLRYDDTISRIAEQFFLSQRTVRDILGAN